MADRRAIVTATAICSCNAAPPMVFDALVPVLPTLAQRLGGEWIAQAMVAFAVFGMGVAGLFTAALLERLGLRRVILASWLVFGVFGSLGLVALSTPVLLASRLVLGFAAGTLMASAGIAVAAVYRSDDRARARMMGISLAVSPFAAVLFLFVAALVSQVSWRAPFGLHGALALIVALPVIAAALPEAAPRERATPPIAWRMLRPAVPAYGLLVLALGVGNIFTVQIAFLLASRGLGDPATVATVTSTLLLGLGVTYAGFGALERRLGMRGTIGVGLVALAGGALLCGSTPMLGVTIAGMICGGVAQGLLVTTALMIVVRRTNPDGVPLALGLATTLIYVAGALAPLVLLPLRSEVGHDGLYLACGMAVIGLGVVLGLRTLLGRPARLVVPE